MHCLLNSTQFHTIQCLLLAVLFLQLKTDKKKHNFLSNLYTSAEMSTPIISTPAISTPRMSTFHTGNLAKLYSESHYLLQIRFYFHRGDANLQSEHHSANSVNLTSDVCTV